MIEFSFSRLFSFDTACLCFNGVAFRFHENLQTLVCREKMVEQSGNIAFHVVEIVNGKLFKTLLDVCVFFKK